MEGDRVSIDDSVNAIGISPRLFSSPSKISRSLSFFFSRSNSARVYIYTHTQTRLTKESWTERKGWNGPFKHGAIPSRARRSAATGPLNFGSLLSQRY